MCENRTERYDLREWRTDINYFPYFCGIVVCTQCWDESNLKSTTEDLHIQLYVGVRNVDHMHELVIIVVVCTNLFLQEGRSVHVQDLLTEWMEEEEVHVVTHCDKYMH